jgi:hypothetical protein
MDSPYIKRGTICFGGVVSGSAAPSQTVFARPSLRLACSGQLRLPFCSSLTWGEDRTEPKIADPVDRDAVVAVR